MLHFSRWKIIIVLLISVLGILYAAPNLSSTSFLEKIPTWLPHKQVHLGLDLQGGSHLLLEMNTDELLQKWYDSIRDDVRKTLRDKKVGYTGLAISKDSIQVRIRKLEQIDEGFQVLRGLAQQLQGSIFSGSGGLDLDIQKTEDGLVTLTPTVPAVTERVNSAISSSIETIRRRVDELGTTEPNIQRQGRARILVQVPGFDDPERLKKIVGGTAALSFQLVDPSISAERARETRVPAGSKIYESTEGDGIEYVLKKRVIVDGEDLVDSQPSFD